MAKILDMPKLSPTMEEGVLSAWHKKEGDAVEVDDLLAEVETDKATMEFRAFDKGTLLKLLVPAGTQVRLGQAVAVLGNAGEDIGPLLAKAGGGQPSAPIPSTEAAPPAQGQEARPPQAQAPQAQASRPMTATLAPPAQARGATSGAQESGPETTAPRAQRAPAMDTASLLDRTAREGAKAGVVEIQGGSEAGHGANGRVLASPYVRKAARELGVDLTAVHGSGPGGRISPTDLDQAKQVSAAMVPAGPNTLEARPAPATHGSSLAPPESRPLSMMRKTIARRLTESKQTVPHFYLTIDVDARALSAFREDINGELAEGTAKAKGAEEGQKPLKISLNDLLIKACATALVRVPECNARFTPEAILVYPRVDISVAVAVPDGLVTPVVRDADKKSLLAVASEVRDLAARARAKKLKPGEMQDGTFSISNLGMFGIDEFSAVINPPEGAILAVGQVREVPVVEDGQVVPGKRLSMTLSCDHRVIDGAVGAAFLSELRALLERPMRILTG